MTTLAGPYHGGPKATLPGWSLQGWCQGGPSWLVLARAVPGRTFLTCQSQEGTLTFGQNGLSGWSNMYRPHVLLLTVFWPSGAWGLHLPEQGSPSCAESQEGSRGDPSWLVLARVVPRRPSLAGPCQGGPRATFLAGPCQGGPRKSPQGPCQEGPRAVAPGTPSQEPKGCKLRSTARGGLIIWRLSLQLTLNNSRKATISIKRLEV